jgi:hypothetical protein
MDRILVQLYKNVLDLETYPSGDYSSSRPARPLGLVHVALLLRTSSTRPTSRSS